MFNSKIVNIIFSIVVAIGLWVYVVGEINPETTGKFQDVPIRFINTSVLADDGLAVVDPGNPLLSVTVSGTRAAMKGLTASEIDVTADLSGLEKGENQITLNVSLPNDMKLQSISSEKVRVTVESLVTADKPVQIQYQGTVPTGTEPGAISILPSTVQVSGAASSVAKVKYVAAVVDAADINGTPQTLKANLTPMNKNAEPISYLSLSQNRVQVEITLLDLKTVPLKATVTGTVPSGYILDAQKLPDTITIKGTAQVLSNIDSISAVPIDISQQKTSVNIPIKLNLPAGIEVSAISMNPMLELVINPETTTSFTYDSKDLATKGLTTGLTVDLPTQSILLSVRSSAKASAGLVAGDFALSLNLGGLSAGTHQVPILVETPKKGLTFSTTPKQIQVIIH